MTRILVVDDEPDVRALVRAAVELAPTPMDAVEAADGVSALAAIDTEKPDLVVLDLALPERDGFAVLSDIRSVSDLPVIVLTARGLEQDMIRGLELGADDYMTKPFSPRELVARINTVLRRAAPVTQKRGTIERGDLRIDLAARRVTRGEREIRLTPTEYALLAELASHAGEALTHDALLTRVWGQEYRSETHYLKVYVARLRDKLEDEPARPRLIVTVRGVGYRFEPLT